MGDVIPQVTVRNIEPIQSRIVLQASLFLDFHVSNCKMTGNSAGMELDELKNVLRPLDDQQIQVSSLKTGRHKQVRKFMRMERKDIGHQFDV